VAPSSSGGSLYLGSLSAGGSVGVVNQSGGTFTINRLLYMGSASGAGVGYGFYNLTGGTFAHAGGATTDARFRIGNAQGTNYGLFYVSGGTAGYSSGNGTLDLGSSATFAAGANAVGVLYVSQTGTFSAPTENLKIAQNSGSGQSGSGQSQVGQLTVGGAGSTTATASFADVTLAGSNASTPGAGSVNLLSGGSLTAGGFTTNSYGSGFLNFNGGTLIVGATGKTIASSMTGVVAYSGGATINTNSYGYTIAAPISAPAGYGLSTVAVSAGGSNYAGGMANTITGAVAGNAFLWRSAHAASCS
jgi:hypothetical protein